MQTANDRKLRVILDVHQFPLAPAEEQMIHVDLDSLARQVENFPVADLHVLIEGNARSNDVSVKLSLVLPGTTLVATDHDSILPPAFERSLRSLIENLQAYKERLGQVPERQKAQKGTLQELHSEVALDAQKLDEAVAGRDYTAFRTSTLALEEGLRKRIGRWVQRYPEFESRIGHGFEIADIVEEVFLLAFEEYPNRPPEVPFGTWLENQIDPAIKALQSHPEEELENINLARSSRAAEQGPETL
jgi:ribosome-associated translation inhibitor RaiA